jgi:branched-chain amino acid transport system ATP-binding protein
MSDAPALISVSGIEYRYGGVLALQGVDLELPAGGFLAVLGPNGAGKSTLAQIMAGVIRPQRGQLRLEGRDMLRKAEREGLVGDGVALIPEGRRLFGQLSVEENLILGAFGQTRAETGRGLASTYEMMPKAVRDGRNRSAVTLSGGEQQMLAIGRALMSRPRAIIVDEPSLGLAPVLTDQVYSLFAQLRSTGVAVAVFEQLANNAIGHADLVAIVDRGRVSYRGKARDAATVEALKAGYLGAV